MLDLRYTIRLPDPKLAVKIVENIPLPINYCDSTIETYILNEIPEGFDLSRRIHVTLLDSVKDPVYPYRVTIFQNPWYVDYLQDMMDDKIQELIRDLVAKGK